YGIAVATPLAPAATPLTSGVQSSLYAATLTTGGATPYACSITTGTLPAGISLDAAACTIAGTPGTAGSNSFTIRIADGSSPAQVVSRAFTLNIEGVLTISTTTLPPGTSGIVYTGA